MTDDEKVDFMAAAVDGASAFRVYAHRLLAAPNIHIEIDPPPDLAEQVREAYERTRTCLNSIDPFRRMIADGWVFIPPGGES